MSCPAQTGRDASHEGSTPTSCSWRPTTGDISRTTSEATARRPLKRGLIFAPIMLGTVMLLSNNLTLAQQLSQAGLIVAIFIPFSYLLDGVFYRNYKRRLARREQS